MQSHKLVLVCAVIIIAVLQPQAWAARILCAAPFFGASHSIFIHSVMQHLAKAGHDVTVITTNLAKNPPPNYKQIRVNDYSVVMNEKVTDIFRFAKLSMFEQILFTFTETEQVQDYTFSSASLKDFLENDKSHFDVVIVEMFYQEAMAMLALKYKAPLVLIGTTHMPRHTEDVMGNPLLPSLVPHEVYKGVGEFTICDRFMNTVLIAFEKTMRMLYYYPMQNRIAKKYFGNVMGTLPKAEDVYNNASLVLLNTHYSIAMTLPIVPGIVEIGGAHIQPAKKLPEKIQKFLDGATNGAIYFALGSHLLSSQIDKSKIDAFLKVFSDLKLKIVWKWEDDYPPKEDYILAEKWLPQNDILAHPNVKAFINHGGMLSLQEALDKGVPLIGIPVFADQPMNVAKLAGRGVAVTLRYNSICEETVRAALQKVLFDPSYRINAKQISQMFKDRQNSPLDTARYWIEYVIRYKGSPILKSPIVNMPLYKYYLLDIFVYAMLFLLFVFYCIKKILGLLIALAMRPAKIEKSTKKLKKK